MMQLDLIDILSKISLLNRDDGKEFTITDRIDQISNILKKSEYSLIKAGKLFHLYVKKSVEDLKNTPAVVVSTHVDCQKKITKCFSERKDDGTLLGTYDNAATNAAILSLMLYGSLPENVVVAFTGDEEEDSKGARKLVSFLKKNDIRIKHIFVLDVTDRGWNEKCDFTVENNFWHDDYGEKIVSCAVDSGYEWRFVPSDPAEIPAFVPDSKRIYREATMDESWEYDDEDMNCCSICVPVLGEMHSNEGVLMREEGFRRYTEVLEGVLGIV